MDQQTSPLTSWPENFHNEPLAPSSGVDDEFSNFLEFGFTFPELDNGTVQSSGSLGQPPTSSMEDVDMMRMNQAPSSQAQVAQGCNHQSAQGVTDVSSMRHHGQEVKQHYQGPNIDQQFYTQGRQQQPQMNPNYAPRYQGIPPTPNSIELHGGAAASYPARIENEARGYEHYSRTNDDQVRFLIQRVRERAR